MGLYFARISCSQSHIVAYLFTMTSSSNQILFSGLPFSPYNSFLFKYIFPSHEYDSLSTYLFFKRHVYCCTVLLTIKTTSINLLFRFSCAHKVWVHLSKHQEGKLLHCLGRIGLFCVVLFVQIYKLLGLMCYFISLLSSKLVSFYSTF